MVSQNCTTEIGLTDLHLLVIELEKPQPDRKLIKSLTMKYGIPYRSEVSEQLDQLLTYLNSLSFSSEREPNPET